MGDSYFLENAMHKTQGSSWVKYSNLTGPCCHSAPISSLMALLKLQTALLIHARLVLVPGRSHDLFQVTHALDDVLRHDQTLADVMERVVMSAQKSALLLSASCPYACCVGDCQQVSSRPCQARQPHLFECETDHWWFSQRPLHPALADWAACGDGMNHEEFHS